MKKKRPGRPNQGKTETIRKRAVTVYLPNEELVKEWKLSAKESGVSVSQFVLEAVERQRSHDYGPALPKLELEKQYEKTQKKLSKLQEKHDILEAAYETREQDLNRLKEHLEQKREGPCDLDLARDMIEVFINWVDDKIHAEEMLEVLGIPDEDLKRIQQVRKAANFLETLGLMKSSGFLTWKWLGERTSKMTYTSKWTGEVYGTKIEISR